MYLPLLFKYSFRKYISRKSIFSTQISSKAGRQAKDKTGHTFTSVIKRIHGNIYEENGISSRIQLSVLSQYDLIR